MFSYNQKHKMEFLLISIPLILLWWQSCNAFPARSFYANQSTLELVHLLFRHGDRTPETNNLDPNNPYYAENNYYPYGYGQLTNVGKVRVYELGKNLRKRYNNFLGKAWNMSSLDILTTDYNRTKMSVELMLAGLWPPTCSSIWNPVLLWQPIPYNYEKRANDKELSPFLGCTTLDALVNEVMNNSSDYINARYGEVFRILENGTGLQNITYLKAFFLYFGFTIQENLNIPLDYWVYTVYPEPLRSLAIEYYYVETNNTKLRTIMSGYLLKKIITDTQNKINGFSPQGRKMHIYSGHETNIAALLLSLDMLKVVELPPYASYLAVEIHRIDEIYGVKIFYQDYSSEDPRGPLKLPECEEFCPFERFVSLVEGILPKSDEECYGSSTK
ncbi:unnamed protein product [Ceutorhynchus assimilis]|uniref:acid phosphatase n=1 Tax=Ceutorhynchus assimilis TaxID=467358 RepID=A0A9N9N0K5_9CUCU|nr:unnamed protein product [Ceutorhynchus assimilis]